MNRLDAIDIARAMTWVNVDLLPYYIRDEWDKVLIYVNEEARKGAKDE